MKDPLATLFRLDVLAPVIETKDPDILREIDELVGQMKFLSWSADQDKMFENLDLKLYNQDGWPVPYGIASYLQIKAYYERKAWEPLAAIYASHSWPVLNEVQLFVEHAAADGRHDLIEKVWRGVVENSKIGFFECIPDREAYPELESVQRGTTEAKRNALAAYDNLIAFYREQDRPDDARQAELDRQVLDEEAFRKPLGDPLKRPMDLDDFWAFLTEVKTGSEGDAITGGALMLRLEELHGPAIRKFYSHYAKTMRRLFHWNVWALAYASLGGCSDDSFHDFRGWLIMRGNADLVDLAIDNPKAAAAGLPEDVDPADRSIYSICMAAYLARTGKLLKGIATDLENPKGREWDEDDFEQSHAELLSVFDRS